MANKPPQKFEKPVPGKRWCTVYGRGRPSLMVRRELYRLYDPPRGIATETEAQYMDLDFAGLRYEVIEVPYKLFPLQELDIEYRDKMVIVRFSAAAALRVALLSHMEKKT